MIEKNFKNIVRD